MLADRAGLTGALSAGLARRGRWPVHDRGRVLVDVAVLIADGGEAIADIDVLRHQEELFGPVASDTTVWRCLDEIGGAQLRRIAHARATARARMWQLIGGPPPARAAGREIGTGVVVLDVDSTLLIAHSDKDGAAPTYKHSYGFHPILVTCDNTGELLAIRLRPGNAGANTAADHLEVLADAIAQLPAGHRGRLLIRGDSAAATHAVLDWLTGQRSRRRQVEYSVGWAIGELERAAITALPDGATYGQACSRRCSGFAKPPSVISIPAEITGRDRHPVTALQDSAAGVDISGLADAASDTAPAPDSTA